MGREFTVALTLSLIRLTIYYQLRKLLLLSGFILLIWPCVLYFVITHNGINNLGFWTTYFSFFIPLFFPIFFGYVFYTTYSKSMSTIRKMKMPVMKFRFTDDWLYVESDLTSGQNAWALYKGIRKYKKLWLLITPSGASHAFPVELLDGELKAFLSSKLPKLTLTWMGYLKWIAFLLMVFLVFCYFLNFYKIK